MFKAAIEWDKKKPSNIQRQKVDIMKIIEIMTELQKPY